MKFAFKTQVNVLDYFKIQHLGIPVWTLATGNQRHFYYVSI